MASSSPSRKRKDPEMEEEQQRARRQELVAKPKKAPPRPKRVEPKPIEIAKPAEKKDETAKIIRAINAKINDFLDLMATANRPANLEDLAYAALEKRIGTPVPKDGDFSKFCSPKGIRTAMELAALLDEAAKTNDSRWLDKWGV